MGRLAVVLGSSATGPRGEGIATVAAGHGAFVLQRHGRGDDFRAPHRIDHAANLRSLLDAGCDRALAVGSVGSLREELGVGSMVCPDDFIALQLGLTIFEDMRGHMTPGFDPDWRRTVLAASEGCGCELRDGATYWQAIGPRFETPAEIRMMAGHADVVGMTIASECVIAGELGLPYAAICVVDNLANGIGAQELSVAALEADREANTARLSEALDGLLGEMAR
jgi:5'-methylthioadenosine phosphorylase